MAIHLSSLEGQVKDNSISKKQEDQYCFNFTVAYVTPFVNEKSFQRIGSILSLNGGVAIKLSESKYLGFEGSTSVSFSPSGELLEVPRIWPKFKFEFTNTERVVTLFTVGNLYNPSLGFQLDAEVILNPSSEVEQVLSGYLLGITQTFDARPGEVRIRPANSWLAISGLKYVKPINGKWATIFKGGIGLRGDSGTNPKLVGNASIALSWDFISAITSFTNAVPERGFPNYFVSTLQINMTTLWRRYISQQGCTINSSLMGF
jgi:hypothetical protein